MFRTKDMEPNRAIKIWTKAGLTVLGEVIRRSREEKGLNLRDAACLICATTPVSVAYSTLGSIEKAANEPKYNTLAAIAASGLVERNGKILNIYDFIEIASESESEVANMEILARLVQKHLLKNKITLQDFAESCRIPLSDMQSIVRGEKVEDLELCLSFMCGYIINPETGGRFTSYLELAAYCSLKKNDLTLEWEQSHFIPNEINGLH